MTETLYCNFLPIERLPRYVYTAKIANDLSESMPKAKKLPPSKSRIKQVIRAAQEKRESNRNGASCPHFVCSKIECDLPRFGRPEGPLASVIDENTVEVVDMASFVRVRTAKTGGIALEYGDWQASGSSGLVIDEEKQGRFFFPDRDGQARTITWTPPEEEGVAYRRQTRGER